MMNRLKILLLTLVLLVPNIVLAATYYTDGTLSSDCTSSDYSIANRTCTGSDGNGYNTIQEAVNVATTAGDMVKVRTGTYAEAVSMTTSGTTNTYITLQGYSAETATITPTSTQTGVNLNGKDWLKIMNLTIDGGQNGIRYMPGSSTKPSKYIIIANNIIKNQLCPNEPQAGISGRADNWEIYGNTLSGQDTTGGTGCRQMIFYGSNYSTLDHVCELNIHDNIFDAHLGADNLHLGGCHNVTIEDNVFNAGSGGTGHDDAVALECTENVTINHNIFNNAQNFDIDAQTCAVGHNLNNTVITNNVFITSNGRTVHIKDGSYTITGNTFYNSTMNAILTAEGFTSGSSIGTIKNNIFSNNTNYNDVFDYSEQTINYNLYYNNGTPNQNDDFGANTISSNPIFISTSVFDGADNIWWTSDDGLYLQDGSPAIGAGESGVDMGAYDYITSGCSTCRGRNFSKGGFKGGFQ